MVMNFLGWEFRKKENENSEIPDPYVQGISSDSAITIGTNAYGYFGHNISFDAEYSNEAELISKYRDVALHPEVDAAITEIVNEAVYVDENEASVNVVLDEIEIGEQTKKAIKDEFDKILSLLNFNEKAHEIFKKWYIDARIAYYIVINKTDTSKGIQELRELSPFTYKKIIEEEYEYTGGYSIPYVKNRKEYFLYSPNGIRNVSKTVSDGVKLPADSVCYVTSGLYDDTSNITYSYLHKALKPANQLRIIEDASIIYRLARSAERRVFNVDVGKLPPSKAEEYVEKVKNRFKNKTTYDATTGELKDSKNTVTMLEDFWFPKSEGRGTEVTTLPSGQNLGEVEDIIYFKKKLYQSLNVPMSRILSEDGSQFSLGRASEITREEVKLSKFINRLRKKFSYIFKSLLKTQLILKNIIDESEWETIKEKIYFDFTTDSYFTELKKSEMLRERADLANTLENYVGTYFSKEYIKKQVFQLTDEEIKKIEEQIENEKKEEPSEDSENEKNRF